MNSVEVRGGIYLAGVDLPTGVVRLEVTPLSDYSSYYGVSTDLEELYAGENLKDKVYVELHEGEFVKIEVDDDDQRVIVTKIR